MPHLRLVLASTSRYRKMLLERLGLPFEVVAPEVDETALPGETPLAIARRLSLAKARAVARARPTDLVIGSDQTATLDGQEAIGKPGSHEKARAQLRAASGRELRFHSGLALVRLQPAYEAIEVVDTMVRFRALDEITIENYLHREQPYDCAGSAKAEGLGIALLESLSSDDPSAVTGLPLIALTRMLEEAGMPPIARA